MFSAQEIHCVRQQIEHLRAPDGSLTLNCQQYQELRWFIQSLHMTIEDLEKKISEIKETFVFPKSEGSSQIDTSNVVYLFNTKN